MSVSAGPGQIYEVLFVLCARLRGLRPYLHHHSFAYLDRRSPLTRLLFRLAGRSATHITLSQHMGARLKDLYQLENVVSVSNAVFLPEPQSDVPRNRLELETLGFLSNLSVEKGIFEFLDLMRATQERGLSVRGLLAGPFDDPGTEDEVRARLGTMGYVDYVGPQYDQGKNQFFSAIDVFVFPTQYRNEADPVVIHEATSRGIPILAFGRGCIPEIVNSDSGLVVLAGEPFVPAAMAKIQEWVDSPRAYRQASVAASAQFTSSVAEGTRTWRALLVEILGTDGERSRESAPQR